VDHCLDNFSRSASTLLAISSEFESSLPDPVDGGLESLALLGQLSQITQERLQTLTPPAQTAPAKTIQELKPLSPVKRSTQSTATRVTPPAHATGVEAKNPLADQALIQALQKLRNSSRFFRRTPANCTTILKNP
jgi:hypothetical protein